MVVISYLFCRFSLGFFRGFQLVVADNPNAVTYRVRSIEPILGRQLVQVFQHGHCQPQVDSRKSHEVIVEASECTRGRYQCAFATHRCASGHTCFVEGAA